jgi:hypothetical protein
MIAKDFETSYLKIFNNLLSVRNFRRMDLAARPHHINMIWTGICVLIGRMIQDREKAFRAMTAAASASARAL